MVTATPHYVVHKKQFPLIYYLTLEVQFLLKNQIIKFLIVGLIFTIFAQKTTISKTEDSGDPVLIGAIYNLTGDQAQLDIESSKGAKLAVEEVNKAGGINGQPVKLILVDGKTDLNVLNEEGKKLANDPEISIVIGLSDSDMVLAAAPPVTAAKKIFITSGATSPLLPDEVPNYLYLSCFGDNVQAAVAAEYAYKNMGVRKVAMIIDKDTVYTRLLSKYFQERFKELGGEIISIQSFMHNAPSFTDYQIKALRSLKTAPDLIFLSAETSNEASIIISRLRDAGFNQPIMGGDGFVDKDLITLIGKKANNTYYTTHLFYDVTTKNNALKDFMNAYKSFYKKEPTNPFAALGYDAASLAINTIQKADTTDIEALLKTLNNTNGFNGATGSISYRRGSRVPLKSASIVHIKDGQSSLAVEMTPDKFPTPGK